MLERKVSAQLDAWSGSGKCLVVRGARQVGKTFSVRQLAQRRYDELVEINFKKTPSATAVFEGDLSVERMVTALRFRFPDKRMEPEKTLLFFDEVQECPEVITSLKFWADDGRYSVAASGSLLGIGLKRPSSYPVGYVTHVTMHGLDFEEYLWARGVGRELTGSLREAFERREPVPGAVHETVLSYFREYCALGGMPEVVQSFVDTDDYRTADAVQRDLLQGYLYDIAHYASPAEKLKAEKCYLSIARQLLGKENHKFQYKEVEKGGKAQKYRSSIDWLIAADIAAASVNVNKPAFDLHDYEIDGNFRLYCTDLSLLLAMREFPLKQAVVEDTLDDNTKGGFYESVVADALVKAGHGLHFHRDDSKHREIDFLVQGDEGVSAIEVKGGNRHSKSLARLAGSGDVARAYKVANANIGVGTDGVVTIPHYMAMYV